ncbi:MAG TPA: heat-inducible transcriptional repressor HrcA [Gammaproteobacteria bacterium]|nr:heat-inducible transcriptional repressor HrcA [Gammaproteobacteria bacterium]
MSPKPRSNNLSGSREQELGERGRKLLKALVERFIREGQPVGSRTLARDAGLDISPATVRNVMADLEDLGLVASPHTSAGRVPTVRGYRLFVDNLLTVQPLSGPEIDRLRRQLAFGEHNAQALVGSASQLLSALTRMAGIVTLPRRDHTGIRQVEFLTLSENRVLAVLVFSDNEVQNRILHVDRPFSHSELQQASNYLNAHLAGRDLMDVRRSLIEEMRRTRRHMDQVMQRAIDMAEELFAGQDREDYVIAGEINLMDFEELSSVDKLRALFDAFQTKQDILHLLDRCVRADGIKVFIGEEAGYEALEECSVVTAPYQLENRIVGVLGVIGPTRMEYERVIPIVDITARLLTAALNSGD